MKLKPGWHEFHDHLDRVWTLWFVKAVNGSLLFSSAASNADGCRWFPFQNIAEIRSIPPQECERRGLPR